MARYFLIFFVFLCVCLIHADSHLIQHLRPRYHNYRTMRDDNIARAEVSNPDDLKETVKIPENEHIPGDTMVGKSDYVNPSKVTDDSDTYFDYSDNYDNYHDTYPEYPETYPDYLDYSDEKVI